VREAALGMDEIVLHIHGRSYWIPGSWNLRMMYTDAIPFPDPRQESNGAG
jgi:hypothetical protein